MTETLGIIAGAFTTLSFLPQVIRVLRLKSAREISRTFTIFYVLGIGLWLIYGLWLGLLPVVLWNSVSLVLAGLLLWAKVKYG